MEEAHLSPDFSYGVEFNDKNCEKVLMGEWTWETGMNLDQIKDFERIRDYGMLGRLFQLELPEESDEREYSVSQP